MLFRKHFPSPRHFYLPLRFYDLLLQIFFKHEKASFAELVMGMGGRSSCHGASAGRGGGLQPRLVGIVHWLAQYLHFTQW